MEWPYLKTELQPRADLLNDFVLWLQTKERSKNTIEKYLYELTAIDEDVENYFSNPNLKNKQLKVSAYRAYLRFIAYKKIISKGELADALDAFQPPKQRGYKHSEKKWSVPKEKWSEYIRKAPNPVAKMGLWLGFHFGLRLGEIIHLRVEDIDFERKLLLIREHKTLGNQVAWKPKYARERQLPLTTEQTRVLRKWIKEVRSADLPIPYLLWMEHGNKKDHRVKERTFQFWCQRAGLHPHVLRYSFAVSAYYASDKDVKLVSELLGHSNVAVTSNYLELDKKDVMDRARKFFEEVGL